MSLDSATVAIEHRDYAAALDSLWPEWKQTRDPTVVLAALDAAEQADLVLTFG